MLPVKGGNMDAPVASSGFSRWSYLRRIPLYVELAAIGALVVVPLGIWMTPYRVYAHAVFSLYIAAWGSWGALDAIWRLREPSSVGTVFAVRMTCDSRQ
jgi:hypothetical protein